MKDRRIDTEIRKNKTVQFEHKQITPSQPNYQQTTQNQRTFPNSGQHQYSNSNPYNTVNNANNTNTRQYNNKQYEPLHRDQNIHCHKCGKQGHVQRLCPQANNTQWLTDTRTQHSSSSLTNQTTSQQPTPNEHNTHYQIIASIHNFKEEQSETEKPIEGKLLINNELITYLCDPGTHRTIISRNTYNKINSPEQPILLQRYTGGELSSCNKKLQVLGTIDIPNCTISSILSTKNVKMLVIEELVNYECIMGRDLIANIPEFRTQVNNLSTHVGEHTRDLINNAETLKKL